MDERVGCTENRLGELGRNLRARDPRALRNEPLILGQVACPQAAKLYALTDRLCSSSVTRFAEGVEDSRYPRKFKGSSAWTSGRCRKSTGRFVQVSCRVQRRRWHRI